MCLVVRAGLVLVVAFGACLVSASPLAWAAGGDLRVVNAARRGDIKALQEALRAKADVNAPQPDGATAIHWAAHRGDALMADALIKAGANVNATEEGGVTALALAATNGDEAMVDRLIKAGAKSNLGRETAVLAAARTGSVPVMRLLLAAGGDPNAKEPVRHQTALMWAASERHPETVRLLIEQGADVKARTQMQAPAPVQKPAPSPVSPPRAREDRPGAPPAQSSGTMARSGAPAPNGANGYTALLFAVRVGDRESVRALLDVGADVNETGADGLSPLVLATVRGHTKLAIALLEKGANAKADAAGFTALHWAAGSWETELTVTSITPDREGEEWATVAGLREGRMESREGAARAWCRSQCAHHAHAAARRLFEEPTDARARGGYAFRRCGGRRSSGRDEGVSGARSRRPHQDQAGCHAADGGRGDGTSHRRGARA